MSQDLSSTGKITKRIASSVQSLRWNIVDGTFVLQMAKEAVVFEDGKFLRLETVWQDVPIVDNAGRIELSGLKHITTAEIVKEK